MSFILLYFRVEVLILQSGVKVPIYCVFFMELFYFMQKVKITSSSSICVNILVNYFSFI